MTELGHVVVIPSTRRAAILAETVTALERQTVPADLVVVAVPDAADVPAGLAERPRVRVILSDRGSSVQRNRALAALDGVPALVTFLDDDIELRADYFERARAFMADRSDVVLMTGLVAADGIAEGEIARPEARSIASATPGSGFVRDVRSAYGCNMTVRGAVALAEPFDERMRLYAWQEDTDFSVRAGRHGRVVHYHGCVGVHMAVGSGRVNGRALGFAQIVNPFYMWRKGSKTARELAHDWCHYLGANLLHVLGHRRPGRADRSGRLAGNLLGLREVALRGGRPEGIEAIAHGGRPGR